MKALSLKKSNLSQEETKLVERMIQACEQYCQGQISFNQLWYRCRGQKLGQAVHKVADPDLSYLLFQLHMDFICWKGERNDIIRKSAHEVLEVLAVKKSEMIEN